MFGTVRNKSNLLPLVAVVGVISGAFLVESGVRIATPAFASAAVQSVAPDQSPETQISNVMKFDNKYFRVTADDSVDMTPLSSATVTKISRGKVQEINIATTSTGTYSTDGLVSDHIKYPGITVERLYPRLIITGLSLVYLPMEQISHYRGTFSRLDAFVQSDDDGCLIEGSYQICK
jgi:hypothetical protein